MLNKMRKATSLLLIVVLVVLVLAPTRVSAVIPGEDSYAGSERVVFSELGKNTSTNLRKVLADYNISVKRDTLLEIVQSSDGDGTVLYATDVDGELITKSVLMAVGEDGNLQSFTAADITAVATDLSGGNATVNPFSNSFQVVFAVSYYAYPYSSDPKGIVQPQTAMFIYMDDNNLYTLSKLTMHYDCWGDEGYFDGVNFTRISSATDGYKYRITKSQTNPNRNTYYSKTDPIDSNKAVLVDYYPDEGHVVTYTIVGVRNSTGANVNITREVPLDLYL